MTSYKLSDDQYSEIIEAESMDAAREHAEESWQDGSWDTKCLIHVRVAELDADGDETGEVEWVDVECGDDPEPPECTEDAHEWCSPHEVVGGLDSNPGVWSQGGTTIVTRVVCRHCGCYKREVSYGSQRNPGQCDTVEYLPADEDSLRWVARETTTRYIIVRQDTLEGWIEDTNTWGSRLTEATEYYDADEAARKAVEVEESLGRMVTVQESQRYLFS